MTKRERMPNYLPDMMAARMTELVQMRANIPREDLEYLVERVDKLKDERLKSCVAALIGWGDDERAERERIAAEWDGHMYGDLEDIDIGAAIRARKENT